MKIDMSTTSARAVRGVYPGAPFHWVGDGFHVSQVIPGPGNVTAAVSPFLMFDYQAPYYYSPTDTPRGVGVHPHRGFETVTIAFEGSVEHHDSTGAGGVINPGDVQWMTAASGILHKEFHETQFARRGGTFHMAQLWVNLPAKHKMDPPRYQGLTAGEMTKVALPGGGVVTLIAGSFGDGPDAVSGPAMTFSPVELWDVDLGAGEQADLPIPVGHNASLFTLSGSLHTADRDVAEHHLAVFDRSGEHLSVTAGVSGVRFLVMAGEPIDEPIASYGPFVMNTREEIVQAIDDFNSGKFGHLE